MNIEQFADSVRGENIEALEQRSNMLREEAENLQRQLALKRRMQEIVEETLRRARKAQADQERCANMVIEARRLRQMYINRTFPWTEKVEVLLKETFKHDKMREKQLAAVNAVLSRCDVLVQMPTASGKSLIYQMATLLEPGFSLVVSPLISLIHDQMFALEELGIAADTISSDVKRPHRSSVYEKMRPGTGLKVLFCTPEWIRKSRQFIAILQTSHKDKLLNRIVIDEVHCCSMWGHDFRPDYSYLGMLRDLFPDVPFLGLTATATPDVIADVRQSLQMTSPIIVEVPANRNNINYSVVPKPDNNDHLIDYIYHLLADVYTDKSGIIYVSTVSECGTMYIKLAKKGLKVTPYHSYMSSEEKLTSHKKWINKEAQAMIATVSFGMGINMADVRFVLHVSIPKTLDNMYQESGRAGRDGQMADCIMLYSLNDFMKNISVCRNKKDEEKALVMLKYCLDLKTCRRLMISNYYEQYFDGNCLDMCDNCARDHSLITLVNVTKSFKELNKIIEHASQKGKKVTMKRLRDAWCRVGDSSFHVPDLPKPPISILEAEDVIANLLMSNHLRLNKVDTSYQTICYFQTNQWPMARIEIQSLRLFRSFEKRRPFISIYDQETETEILEITPSKARPSYLQERRRLNIN